MALTAKQRRTVALVLSDVIGATEPVAFTKAQLTNAVEAADVWLDANAAALDAALPAAFRNRGTAAQKAALIAVVCEHRRDTGAV